MKDKYKNIDLKVPAGFETPGSRMPGDPIIEISFVDINYKIFQKSPAEKAQLKAAKAQCKYDEMRRK